MHWSQPRPLTVMEVRRAQGVPDDEVLCGTPRDQWKLVGNAVARQVSIALGLKLREAWAGSLYEDGVGNVPVEDAAPVSPASTAHATIVHEQEPARQIYIVIDDEGDDDDDDNLDEMSLGGLTSQAGAGPSSSTRATSFVEVQEE